MESMNQIYSLIYKVYENFREERNELAAISWGKLETYLLEDKANRFQREVKLLGKSGKIKDPDRVQPFVKLQKAVSGFLNSIPQIT